MRQASLSETDDLAAVLRLSDLLKGRDASLRIVPVKEPRTMPKTPTVQRMTCLHLALRVCRVLFQQHRGLLTCLLHRLLSHPF